MTMFVSGQACRRGTTPARSGCARCAGRAAQPHPRRPDASPPAAPRSAPAPAAARRRGRPAATSVAAPIDHLPILDGRRQHPDRRRADEPGHVEIGGRVVELVEASRFARSAIAHHRDAVPHEDRFLLVVGDVEGGDREIAQQLLHLHARAFAQLGVEIADRFVHQEEARVAHDAAPNRHPLLLAAGERGRHAPHQVIEADPHDLGHFRGSAARPRLPIAGGPGSSTPGSPCPASTDRARSPGRPSRRRGPAAPSRSHPWRRRGPGRGRGSPDPPRPSTTCSCRTPTHRPG